MIWAIYGILTGIILGLLINFQIPLELTKYTAVLVVGILDSLFGAIKEELSGKKYSSEIFLSGLLINIVLALLITLLGEQLGLDLYLAVAVVFTFRIFSNSGIIRRKLLSKIARKR